MDEETTNVLADNQKEFLDASALRLAQYAKQWNVAPADVRKHFLAAFDAAAKAG